MAPGAAGPRSAAPDPRPRMTCRPRRTPCPARPGITGLGPLVGLARGVVGTVGLRLLGARLLRALVLCALLLRVQGVHALLPRDPGRRQERAGAGQQTGLAHAHVLGTGSAGHGGVPGPPRVPRERAVEEVREQTVLVDGDTHVLADAAVLVGARYDRLPGQVHGLREDGILLGRAGARSRAPLRRAAGRSRRRFRAALGGAHRCCGPGSRGALPRVLLRCVLLRQGLIHRELPIGTPSTRGLVGGALLGGVLGRGGLLLLGLLGRGLPGCRLLVRGLPGCRLRVRGLPGRSRGAGSVRAGGVRGPCCALRHRAHPPRCAGWPRSCARGSGPGSARGAARWTSRPGGGSGPR